MSDSDTVNIIKILKLNLLSQHWAHTHSPWCPRRGQGLNVQSKADFVNHNIYCKSALEWHLPELQWWHKATMRASLEWWAVMTSRQLQTTDLASLLLTRNSAEIKHQVVGQQRFKTLIFSSFVITWICILLRTDWIAGELGL